MDVYEICYLELLQRIEATANITALFSRHGIRDGVHAFNVGQLFSPNAPLAAQRFVLRDLGYDFDDEQSVSIVASRPIVSL